MLRAFAHHVVCCCVLLRLVGSCWMKFDQFQTSSNNFQQVATTRNNTQHGVQTLPTCWAQQCCERLHGPLLRNSGQYNLNTIFYNCKALAGFFFCSSCFNTAKLEIFLSLEHFCCLLSTPHFAKLSGCRQRYLSNENFFP